MEYNKYVVTDNVRHVTKLQELGTNDKLLLYVLQRPKCARETHQVTEVFKWTISFLLRTH
jgi:hypothetical protein